MKQTNLGTKTKLILGALLLSLALPAAQLSPARAAGTPQGNYPDRARALFDSIMTPVTESAQETAKAADAQPQNLVKVDIPAEKIMAAPVAESDAAVIRLSLQETLLRVLENNRELKVRRYAPEINRTAEESALAKFDLGRSVDLNLGKSSRTATTINGKGTDTDTGSLGVTLSKLYESGTKIQGTLSENFSSVDGAISDDWRTNFSLTLSTPLRQGRGSDVNLAAIRQARNSTAISNYELRAYIESLVAQTESAYWDCLLTKRQIQIYTESLSLARQQLKETREKIKVGQIAQTELAAALAEVALRNESLINANSNYETALLKLRKLLSIGGTHGWTVALEFPEIPARTDETMDPVESCVENALTMRPEVNQSLLSIRNNDLQLVVTRNGLLPRLDFFITLGRTGYADSFGDSVSDIDNDSYDLQTGLSWELAKHNRSARATHRRATLNMEMARESLENLMETIQVDVRSAWIEANRALNQIPATGATRRSQEETYRAENEKYKVGLSTSYLVSQAQRDLLSSQIAEVQAVVNYYKALVSLWKSDGSLLLRRGIDAPGARPVSR